jgi:hypothetical protein
MLGGGDELEILEYLIISVKDLILAKILLQTPGLDTLFLEFSGLIESLVTGAVPSA